MATNIPPHNLGELVDVLSVIIQNPEATVSNIPLLPFGSLSFNIIMLHI
jgi:DNA gyrase/topoisomerase IV subunit A